MSSKLVLKNLGSFARAHISNTGLFIMFVHVVCQ